MSPKAFNEHFQRVTNSCDTFDSLAGGVVGGRLLFAVGEKSDYLEGTRQPVAFFADTNPENNHVVTTEFTAPDDALSGIWTIPTGDITGLADLSPAARDLLTGTDGQLKLDVSTHPATLGGLAIAPSRDSQVRHL